MNKHLVRVVIAVTVLVFGLFLIGCYPGNVTLSEPSHDSQVDQTGFNMADRIRFQDQVWAREWGAATVARSPIRESGGLQMADRIRFQDRLSDVVAGRESAAPKGEMSMGDRIRFHDRLCER